MTTEEQLSQILSRLNQLESENKSLREQIESKAGIGFAENIPQSLRSDDPAIQIHNSRFARSVILGTRAAYDHSLEVGNPLIVDPGGLVRNSGSNPLKE
jgi:hypothetical protein